jgi:hypothetical protein
MLPPHSVAKSIGIDLGCYYSVFVGVPSPYLENSDIPKKATVVSFYVFVCFLLSFRKLILKMSK